MHIYNTHWSTENLDSICSYMIVMRRLMSKLKFKNNTVTQ